MGYSVYYSNNRWVPGKTKIEAEDMNRKGWTNLYLPSSLYEKKKSLFALQAGIL
jgi:hypothetical protein